MKRNIIANFIGKIWGVFSNFIFIPFYIHLLGFSSYAVISYTLVMAGVLTILDSGLTATLSREFSRQDQGGEEKRKIYETLQIVYFSITLFGILLIILFSNLIASGLNVRGYEVNEISFFLKVASFDLSFQLLFRFYLGGLFGLNKQISANLIQVLWGVLRNGIVLIIIFFSPSLNIFFIWQAISTIVCVLIVKYVLDKNVYIKPCLKFKIYYDSLSFSKVKSFASGMLLISVISAISSQSDKLMISKMINLENLGYYTLAVSMSSILIVVISPISTAILPKLTEYYSINNVENVKKIFKQYNILIAIIVFSFLANLIFFDRQLIEIWTKDSELATLSYKYVPFVGSAYAFIVLQTMYYQIALANGYTKLNNILGFINTIIVIPAYYFACRIYGSIGISVVFMLIQSLLFFIYCYLMNKKYIQESFFKNLILKQFIFPAFIAFGVAYSFYVGISFLDIGHFITLMLIGLSIVISIILSWLIFAEHEDKNRLIGMVVNFKIKK